MPQKLVIFTDGGCQHNPGPAAIGVVIKEPNGSTLDASSLYIGPATNNQAEYQAVIAGLEKALLLGAAAVEVNSDSLLVVEQISGQYKVKDPALKALLDKTKALQGKFREFKIRHIPREENGEADRLACEALKNAQSKKPELEFAIRPATMKDMEGMNRVWGEVEAQHAAALPSIFRRVANPSRDRRYVASILADRNSAIFVAELNQTIIGLVQVMLQEAPDVPYMAPRRFAKVSDLVVTSSFQHRGVGGRLMQEAEMWAKNKRAGSMELNVYEFNSGARNFYQGQGYETGSRMMWKQLEEKK